MEMERLRMPGTLDSADRPPMNQEEYDHEYGHQKRHQEQKLLGNVKKKLFSTYCAPFTGWRPFLNTIFGFMPILDWLPKYKFREDFAADVVGGLTTGIMHMPQGIAYSILAHVDPVYGLYASCFPAFFYMFFGTSRHTSLGSFAVVALMAGVANDKVLEGYKNVTIDDSGLTSISYSVTTIQVATTLTFAVGVWQLLFGLLKLQFLMTYLSDPLVSGFTTGAAVHVLVSQFDDIMGVNVPKVSGPGYIFVRIYDLICLIPSINFFSLGISICSMVFLYVGKEYFSPFIAKKAKLPLPIPFELILLMLTAGLSPLFSWNKNYDVMVVGVIPTGVPRPEIPNLAILKDCMFQSAGIGIVTIAIHISMAKMLAKKMNYKIDSNQELYALGFADILGSMFPIYPVSTALGRTMVSVKSGTRTQLSSIFSCSLLLAIILFLGPLLEQLPKCVLASIIVIALQSMFQKFSDLKKLWPISKADCLIWLIAFISTAFIDVMEGLLISLIFAIMSVIFRTQWPRWRFLIEKPSAASSGNAVKDESRGYNNMALLRFNSPLLFTNIERFQSCISKTMAEWDAELEHVVTQSPDKQGSIPVKEIPRYLLIDCSGISYIDFMGISILKEVSKELLEKNTNISLIAVNEDVHLVMEKSDFFKIVPKEHLFPTVRDAVAIANRNTYALEILCRPKSLQGEKIEAKPSETQSEVDLQLLASSLQTPAGQKHHIVKLTPPPKQK